MRIELRHMVVVIVLCLLLGAFLSSVGRSSADRDASQSAAATRLESGASARTRRSPAPRTRSPARQKRWHEGGNLHKATVGEWKSASNRNKVATAADWLASTKWKGRLNTANDFNRLREKATVLAAAVDESVRDVDLDGLSAMEIAAVLISLSDDLGP